MLYKRKEDMMSLYECLAAGTSLVGADRAILQWCLHWNIMSFSYRSYNKYLRLLYGTTQDCER